VGLHIVCYGKCNTYARDEVEAALSSTLALFGGWRSRLPAPPAHILVKPNLLADFPPEKHVTTHPAVVRAVVKSLLDAGYEVTVGDAPAPSVVGVEKIWAVTGIGPVCDELGVKWLSFDAAGHRQVAGINPVDPDLTIARPVLEADAVVNLPKFKTHGLTLLTGGVKNLYGYIPGMRKPELHKKALHPADFALVVADVFRARPPEVTIFDAVTAMHGSGPSAGRPYPFGRLVIADNAAAGDHSLALKVGADVDLLPLERACLAYGLFDPAGIEERGDVPAVVHDFKLPVTYWIPRLPLPFGRFLSRKTRFFPEIHPERCTRCGLCARTCPNGAIHRGQGDYSIDYSRCIACMCCQEICPSHAVRLGGTGAARAFRVFRGLSRRLSRGGRKPTPAA
jgi:uncharacterized protein (DUF362 family)/Pyruvate/2-oxoacid:ferredoxin oxidoreductase delta subunit